MAHVPVREPTVSVVVPFLNAGRFLHETIESVFAQSYADWELLLCDDGSSDESTRLAQTCAEVNPGRVTYLEHERHANRGASAARNLGLRHARGRLVALLDADDVWLPDKVNDQVRLLDAHPQAGMLYGNTLYWHSWTGDARDAKLDHQQTLGVPVNTVLHPPEVLIGYLRGSAAIACTCSILARREVVERVGGFEDAFPALYDDQAFYAKMLLSAPVLVADRVWDKYRIHSASMCARAERRRDVVAAHLRYLDWLEQYSSQRGWADGPLRRALRANRWRTRHPQLARLYRGLGRGVLAALPQRLSC